MEEAQRLTVMEPVPESSPRSSPLPTIPGAGTSALEILHNIDEDDSDSENSTDRQKKLFGKPKTNDAASKPFFSKQLMQKWQENPQQQKTPDESPVKKMDDQQQQRSASPVESPRRNVPTSNAPTGDIKTTAQKSKSEASASKESTPTENKTELAPSADGKRSKSPMKSPEEKSQWSAKVTTGGDEAENGIKCGSPKRPAVAAGYRRRII
jgi:hypothetical protein